MRSLFARGSPPLLSALLFAVLALLVAPFAPGPAGAGSGAVASVEVYTPPVPITVSHAGFEVLDDFVMTTEHAGATHGKTAPARDGATARDAMTRPTDAAPGRRARPPNRVS